MSSNKIVSVDSNVQWIGVLDPDLKVFDIVMETKYGTTYNSYFINAEKKTVIDTVKANFKDEYLAKIQQVCNPAEIEYIVMNHTEPDHSGSLAYLLDIAPNATVVGSGQALTYLTDIMNRPFKSLKVKDGDTLDLGNKTLRFIGAPNLHWPDTIYSYLEGNNILFTCDSFGAHFCSDAIFDDEAGDYDDAFKHYFDCILQPFSKFMLKAIEKVRALDIRAICPGHGPILRTHWKRMVYLSEKLSSDYVGIINGVNNQILIVYVSAYGYTKQMAQWIKEGIEESGNWQVECMDIEHALLGDMEAAITKSNALIVGSPTINQNTLLPIYRLFAVINPLRDRGKQAATFGSYGWSGEAVDIIEANMKALKLKVTQSALKGKFFPGEAQVEQLKAYGRSFVEQLV